MIDGILFMWQLCVTAPRRGAHGFPTPVRRDCGCPTSTAGL